MTMASALPLQAQVGMPPHPRQDVAVMAPLPFFVGPPYMMWVPPSVYDVASPVITLQPPPPQAGYT